MTYPMAAMLATLLAATAAAAPPSNDEPLDPDKAFIPQARFVVEGPGTAGADERHGIDIEYRIAPGYYLYRDRLRFELSPPTLPVGPPEIPPGTQVDDPFIGKTAILRDRVTIHLPFMASMVSAGRYKVRITAQGCAEERLCYSPFPQEVAVTVPTGYRMPPTSTQPRPKGLPR